MNEFTLLSMLRKWSSFIITTIYREFNLLGIQVSVCSEIYPVKQRGKNMKLADLGETWYLFP